MKVFVHRGEGPPSITYSSPNIPPELDGEELTYQDFLRLGLSDNFLHSFFNSEHSDASWYRDSNGPVYRKVIHKRSDI